MHVINLAAILIFLLTSKMAHERGGRELPAREMCKWRILIEPTVHCYMVQPILRPLLSKEFLHGTKVWILNDFLWKEFIWGSYIYLVWFSSEHDAVILVPWMQVPRIVTSLFLKQEWHAFEVPSKSNCYWKDLCTI